MTNSSPYTPGTVLLAVGTKRGLFLLTSQDREQWQVHATALTGRRVFSAALDQRTSPRLYAADNGDFFGSFLRYSDDFGATWQEARQNIEYPESSGQKLNNIWTIVPGRADEPETLYAGTDPAALWVSHDRGETWEPDAGLLHHPTRDRWEPGAGGLCLHTIIPDPTNASRMWIGISAVGCMRTDDGGQSWVFANKNTPADFLPDKYPEFGQCVHRIIQHPTDPTTLYQQNHCGLFKTYNGGEDWIDMRGNLPSKFGFPIAVDAHHRDTLFVIVENDARNNIGEHFTVYRSQNAGENWEPLTNGLPQGPGVMLGVLRHGMCTDTQDPCGVYVGTNTGQLFASNNRGENWNLIADFLPSIYSVSATVLV